MRTMIALLMSLAIFAPMSIANAAAADFTFESWFQGNTFAKGRFTAVNGVRRNFDVDLTGRWNGRTLTLREDFTYEDGVKDRKTWRFTKTGPTTYRGTREDVIGETTVTIVGKVARFSYEVYLDGAAKKNRVRFFDRMVLQGDGTIVNTALVTKFGLPVAWTRVDFSRD